MEEPSDERLVTLHLNGHGTAAHVLYERYSSTVERSARTAYRRYVTRHWEDDTEPAYTLGDARQEAYICFLGMLRTWNPALSPLGPYLGAYLSRRIERNLMSHIDKRDALIEGFTEEEWREKLVDLRDALATLPPTTRQVLMMYYSWGLSFNKIAANLNTNPKAIQRVHLKALARLREMLEEELAQVTGDR